MSAEKKVRNSPYYIEITGRILKHVNLVSKNGETLLASETYFSAGNAKRAANKVARALDIPVVENN